LISTENISEELDPSMTMLDSDQLDSTSAETDGRVGRWLKFAASDSQALRNSEKLGCEMCKW